MNVSIPDPASQAWEKYNCILIEANLGYLPEGECLLMVPQGERNINRKNSRHGGSGTIDGGVAHNPSFNELEK